MTTLSLRSLAIALAAFCATFAARAAEPPGVVGDLDLRRYAGLWHEIARYPNFFQRNCAREVTASYTLQPNGRIAVVNACRRADGAVDSVRGEARVVSPGKLEVRFAPAWLSFLPFVWADYWVIDLAPDYGYAVVGNPSREYLWILARDARMDDATYARIAARVTAMGYDAGKLVRDAP